MDDADVKFVHQSLKRCDLCTHKVILVLFLYFVGTQSLSADVSVTYDHLYTSGLNAYVDGKWFQCAAFLEKAIQERKFHKQTLNDCRLECRKNLTLREAPIPLKIEESVDLYRLELFEGILKESHCLKKCRKERLGSHRADNRVLEEVEEDFKSLKPYSYLQFCYYQLERYTEAACAAYTFFLRNPKDEDTIRNIQTYRQQYQVQDKDFKDLEKLTYQIYRIKGELAYDNDDWPSVIEWVELALTEFYKEEERCRVDCEGHFDHQAYPDFIHAVADHYISVLQCQFKCEKKLSILHKEYLADYVGQHYNYLQYAYHKMGENDKAVEATATYLLFNPNDPEMSRNKAFYMQKLGYHQAHFVPRQEAVEYSSRRDKMLQMLYYVRDEYDYYLDDEIEENYEEKKLLEEDLDRIKMVTLENINRKNLSEGKEHYMNVYKKIGINITTDRQDRFVADDFYRPDQCRQLIDFVNIKAADSNGVRKVMVTDGLQLIKDNPEQEISLRLFLRASELGRHFSAHYHNKTNLFIKSAAIVCVDKTVNKGKMEECISQEDGTCLTEDEIENGRDILKDEYVMIAFLTNEEKPGHFSLLDRRFRRELPVVSKCGRVVGFKASDRYRSDDSGSQRCSMVMTLTTNRKEDNPTHREASSYLLDQEKGRLETKVVNNTEEMQKFYDNGVSIAYGKKDFQGRERFAADGLMTPENCQMFIDMIHEGGISGDGYENDVSPHTQHETFRGLTISRSTEKSVEDSNGSREENLSPHTNNEYFTGLNIWHSIELAHVGVLSKEQAQLYLNISEYGRSLVEKYFNLSQPLYFDYTHLVCRTAKEGAQEDRDDLSHPVHGDNCELQDDGVCLRQFPSYVQRDYSGLIYLNDDFDGGEFFFAHGNKSEQVLLKPRCGRLVGFNAAELHGVRAVSRGKRCALAMWFTLDLNHKELARIQAQKMLDNMPDKKELELPGISSEQLNEDFGDPEQEEVDDRLTEEFEETLKRSKKSMGPDAPGGEMRSSQVKSKEQLDKADKSIDLKLKGDDKTDKSQSDETVKLHQEL